AVFLALFLFIRLDRNLGVLDSLFEGLRHGITGGLAFFLGSLFFGHRHQRRFLGKRFLLGVLSFCSLFRVFGFLVSKRFGTLAHARRSFPFCFSLCFCAQTFL